MDTHSNPEVTSASLRAYLQQVVQIHAAMFDKLLSKELDLPLELAEMFEDAANTYLDMSEMISERHRRLHPLDPGQLLDPGVELTWRVIEPELVAEPRVSSPENMGEPVKD